MDNYQQEITAVLHDDFEKDILLAAITYLEKEDDPLRFSSFCYSIRELLRHVLVRLSPDHEVQNCELWFKPETANSKPNSRQRLFYAIWGGLSQHLLKDVLNIDISKSWNDIRVSFKTIASTAHITHETLYMSHEQCQQQGQELLKSLSTIFAQITSCHAEIANSLKNYIDDGLLDTFISISFSELDLADTQVTVKSSHLESFEVSRIDSQSIYIEGNGTVIAIHSEESSQNEKRYPFSFNCTSDVTDPKRLTMSADNINIDLSEG